MGNILKNPILVIFIGALALTAAAGCGKKPITFTSRHHGYTMKFPSDWKIHERDGGTSVTAVSPEEDWGDNFRENITVFVETLDGPISTEEYLEASAAKLKIYLMDYRIHDRGIIRNNGTALYWLTGEHRPGSDAIKFQVYYLVKNKKGYSISCSALPETFDAYKGLFKDTALSFSPE
jgi:hypothetical protein